MKFKLKDPGSAITHGIALLLAAVGAVPLIIKAARSYDVLHIVALSIFILTMVLLYAASTIYHSVDSTEKVNRRLRKMDHMMIFVMIAGSYTPVCLIVLHNRIGYILCALVWSIAVLGIILKGCWITCPKWLSGASTLARNKNYYKPQKCGLFYVKFYLFLCCTELYFIFICDIMRYETQL